MPRLVFFESLPLEGLKLSTSTHLVSLTIAELLWRLFIGELSINASVKEQTVLVDLQRSVWRTCCTFSFAQPAKFLDLNLLRCCCLNCVTNCESQLLVIQTLSLRVHWPTANGARRIAEPLPKWLVFFDFLSWLVHSLVVQSAYCPLSLHILKVFILRVSI